MSITLSTSLSLFAVLSLSFTTSACTSLDPIDTDQGTPAGASGEDPGTNEEVPESINVGDQLKDVAFCNWGDMETGGSYRGTYAPYSIFDNSGIFDAAAISGTYSGNYRIYHYLYLAEPASQVCFKTEAEFPSSVAIFVDDLRAEFDVSNTGATYEVSGGGTIKFNQKNVVVVKTACRNNVPAGEWVGDGEFWSSPLAIEGWNFLAPFARIKVTHKAWIKFESGLTHSWTTDSRGYDCTACMTDWFGCQ